ncbi:hypothetical protein ACTMTI_24460 [Nonomuraea sp. H19]|uniref:hypothetical protein n=1 Tax=Nonomuraea sp. H19 TaxID=3452206 RepID=UPI003F8C7742
MTGDAVAKGGVGAIYRTTDPQWMYKEYSSPDKAPRPAPFQRLVDVGRDILVQQGLPIAARPESSVNWPVDIIRDRGGRIEGCVLPAIPQRYFRADLGKVNTLDFLVMRRGRPPAALSRVIVLLRLAEILAYVHDKRLVHGDLNAKNVAWTLDPQPTAYLIDCDGMVPQHPPPTVGVQAAHWTDPRVIDKVVPAPDHYSDWYCLALAFYRGLLLPQGGSLAKHNGVWAAPSQIPHDLDPRIATLLRRGLANALDASGRPEPAEWVRAVLDVYVQGERYDDQALALLDRALTAPLPDTSGPGFVQMPRPHPPAPPARPRTMPTARPVSPPPRPQPHPTGPRPLPGPPQPTWRQPVAPSITYTPFPAQPFYRPPQAFARWAMNGGKRWWIPLLLLTILFWPVGLVLCSIVLVQALTADPDAYGRMKAIVSSTAGIAMCSLHALLFLISLIAI